MTTSICPPLPARPGGAWFGWGISLLVHACVLAWLVHAWQAHAPAPDVAPPAPMRFVLVPPKPQAKAPVTVEVPAASARAPKTAAAAAARPARSRPAPSASAPAAANARTAATPAESAATIGHEPAATSGAVDAASVAAESAAADAGAGDSAPHLDMKAARATARLIDKHRKDGLVARVKPDPPLQRDDRLERAIERARRPDCKSAYSGLGLLAVIPLAKDAVTGTGCKW
jgi:hypothetical protein